MLLESVRDGMIRECPSELLESRNDLVSMVCAWDAFVEEGSAIDTSLIQHSLLECTSPVFLYFICVVGLLYLCHVEVSSFQSAERDGIENG